jgi:hypothetical protein
MNTHYYYYYYYYYLDQHEILPATCILHILNGPTNLHRSLSDVGCGTGDHSRHDLSVKYTEYRELLLK